LERVVAGLLASEREFGPVDDEFSAALDAPIYTPDERRALQLARLRRLARRAAEQVPYYQRLFERSGVDPCQINWQQLEGMPTTSRHELRERPQDFIAQDSRPVLTVETTGTTGGPTGVAFSDYELRVMQALGTIGFMLGRLIASEDVLVVATSPRALGSLSIATSARRIGAHVRLLGAQHPVVILTALSTRRRMPGHTDRPSLLSANPSYLGMLVEAAARTDLGPADFALRQIFTGGELLSAGLRARLAALFGEIGIEETYALTETLPFGARVCRDGHLHFEATNGLLELINPFTGRRAEPGDDATTVATPLPPVRETTLLLRYDTEDIVEVLPAELDCELRHQPACSRVKGKLAGCARLDDGRLVTPRQVVEALEASPHVPLPARYGLRSCGDGVAVETVVRNHADAQARRDVAERLLDAGVPLRELRMIDDPGELSRPMPLRGDLREPTHSSSDTLLSEVPVG
jgi:phenylacetate-coenzyme A ligase PaaK-like adenylate-forming protein